MADDSPPGSPLSDLSSEAFEIDEENERMAAETQMPPAKRQKTSSEESISLRTAPTSRSIKMEATDVSAAHISPIVDPSSLATSYPPELGITLEEEAKGPVELWKLLRKQIKWAEEEGAELRKQCELMEELRKKEWMEKEVLLDHVIERELDWNERRKEVLAGLAKLPMGEITFIKNEGPNSPTTRGVMSPNGGTPFSPRDLTPLDQSQGPVETDAAEVFGINGSRLRKGLKGREWENTKVSFWVFKGLNEINTMDFLGVKRS
ncbi:hypothetical protein DID88_001199 [Monilinia fructigena]|uniref:Uncharacterized protein n=1 Tax=Monilinia fructigena TaxID=38457 RepID=A0A395IXV8_9HELO|nr:hypothetical protein DID88_001199 [Monilinia fructigena]